MSFRNCIDDAEREGALTPEQAKEARDLFTELEDSYQGRMNKQQATSQAGADALKAMQVKVALRKRQRILQLKTWQRISKDMDDYRTGAGAPNPYRAATAHFEQDGTSRFSSAIQRKAEIEGRAFAEMSAVLGTFRRNIVGEVRKKAQLKNMVKEVFGESTGDAAARELAEAWARAAEYTRLRFNRAGGAIPNRKDWGMPQIHDMLAIRKAGYEEWRNFIEPRLNRGKMVDEQTGLAFSPEKFELVLRDVYETVSTDGMNKLKPGGVAGGKSIANRRQDHRFLVFKDGSSWLEYQERFGNANPFDTMISHVSSMARDTALMEIFGPNPRATINFMKQRLSKKSLGVEKLEDKARRTGRQIDELYLAFTGNNNAPVNGFFASTFAGLRQTLQSAQLGAASIGAITDLNFQRIARQFSGLPQVGVISDYLKQLNPLNAQERGQLAIRLGLIAEGWTSIASGQMRYVGDISGPEITRRVADFVMRASLLSPMTQAGRWAFGMEFLGTLADNSSKAFKELDPTFRNTLERYNINESAWNIIRATDLYDHQGAKFLRPADIEARTDVQPELARNLATRILEMVNTETEFAVPSSSLRGRVALTGETRPGTIAGELSRSFAMYKAFGVTLVNTHLARGMSLPGAGKKGAYFSNLIISTTLMGALAMQLKEMSKGRDPRPMTDSQFWLAAMLQGGGLGIYGDFLFSDVNRYDRGLSETIAGPVVGFANDVRNLTVGNLVEVATGEDTNAASELINFTKRYVPGSSLWYLRLGLERMVFDQLTLMADPQARSKMRRTETRFKREFGQNYWWAPGDVTPERAPNIENITLQR